MICFVSIQRERWETERRRWLRRRWAAAGRLCSDKAIFFRADRHAGKRGIPGGVGRDGGGERDFARAGAAFVNEG